DRRRRVRVVRRQHRERRALRRKAGGARRLRVDLRHLPGRAVEQRAPCRRRRPRLLGVDVHRDDEGRQAGRSDRLRFVHVPRRQDRAEEFLPQESPADRVTSVAVERILVNGDWVDACSPRALTIANPATLAELGAVPDCSAADVDRAVAAARAAQPNWWKVPGVEKARLLRQVGARIRERERQLSTLMTLETGKPLCESVDCIDWVAACFEYYGEVARSSYGNSIPPVARHQLNFTIKEPYGVVAAIVPFNFPLLLMAWKVAPAIAAGNTVVCKPPHQNPLSNLLMARCYDALPPGVVNVVTGGPATGEALVRHPDVDMIAFTGSTAVGRRIAVAAAAQLKKVNLELGSIDPFIVFKDADLDVAVPVVLWARMLNAGQVCTSSKRIYVEQPIADAFLRRLETELAALVVGDPMHPHTDLGPLI